MFSRHRKLFIYAGILLAAVLILVIWGITAKTGLFFFFSKVLQFILMPLTWIFILFVWSRKTKIEKRRKKLFWGGLAALYIFTNSFIADECMRLWEVKYDRIDFAPEQTQNYDYAIVLGGMTWYNPALKKVQFQRSSDRLFQALWLLKQGKIKKIIFTGGSGSIDHPEDKEGEHIAKWYKEMGFPDSCFISENESRNTFENAVNTKKILENLNYKNSKVLLITSSFHMRRALACFKKAGVEGLRPYITDCYSGPRKFGIDHCLIPSSDALQVYNLMIHEIVGYITYKIKGYC